MKKNILRVALVLAAILSVRAETCPLWNSITVTTSEPGKSVTIQAAQDANRLTSVVVTVDGKIISIPDDELKDTPDPQLHTLRLGYWSKDLKKFYIFVTCGRLNSFPHGRQPKDVYFYFENGRFIGKQSSPTPISRDRTTAPPLSPDVDKGKGVR